MYGESGTSHTKDIHYYYLCGSRRKKRCPCTMKAIKKQILEDMVVNTITQLLNSEQNIQFLTNAIFNYHQKHSQDNINLKLLEQRRKETFKASQNILKAIEQGIIMQAGHTNATYQNMLEGMQVRIMHTTHLFNAMSRMHHRDPGAVGAVLIHPELSCEFIADGIHIDPNLIKLLVQYKPSDKLVVVTDSLKPTKQKADKLYANNEEVYLDKCFYRKSDNVIAGSAMTMIDSIKNLVSWGLSVEQAVQMSSANPTQILRIPNKGIIAPGYDADLVVFNQDFHIMHTILNGQIYQEK